MAALKDIWAMLRKCAPGFTRELTDHSYCVKYNGLTFPSLPKGPHGQPKKGQRAGRAEIEIGYVRQMVNQFEIMECAKKYLPL